VLGGRQGCLVAPADCDSGQLRGSLLDHQGLDIPASVVGQDGAKRLPDAAGDLGGELRPEPGVRGQDGLVGGVGPVVSGGGVEVAAVPAQGQGGAQDQVLGVGVPVLAEQVVGLAEDDIEFAGVVVPDF